MCKINERRKTNMDQLTLGEILAFVNHLKRKGMTLNDARRILTSNYLFFGCMLVKMGLADGMVGGWTTPAANLLLAAFRSGFHIRS